MCTDSLEHPPARLDAIFIPTFRQDPPIVSHLESLAASAETIWLLSSGFATSSLAEKRRSFPNNVVVCVIPDPQMTRWFLDLSSSQNPSQFFDADYDLPLKRNFAIQAARTLGFERICLLDDDITISLGQVQAAASALSAATPVASFLVSDFPDLSTMEHVNRLTSQCEYEIMPGGNCLFLKLPEAFGLFPYIYNEDWFFIHVSALKNRIVKLGDVKQEPHRPWTNLTRVRFEEFGEVIITGILDEPDGINSAKVNSETYWKRVIVNRARWLEDLSRYVSTLEFKKAVETATLALSSVDSKDCTYFISALKKDQEEIPCIPNLSSLLSSFNLRTK